MSAFDDAREHFLAGVARQQVGDWAGAEAQYRASLHRLPDRPSTLANLGAVLVQAGRADEALPLLDRAAAQTPDDAMLWEHRALALVALQRDEDALVSFDQAGRLAPPSADAAWQHAQCALRLNRLPQAQAACAQVLRARPDDAQAWALNGSLLKDLGRSDEAVPALQRAIALGTNAAANAVNGYLLASLLGRGAPPQPPPGYVQSLFDGYAAGFDEHLVGRLQYRAPAVLTERLAATGRRFESALDLGCGTGLCGAALRPLAARLVGVDLSPAMLAQARLRHVYDALEAGDLAAHLHARIERHDLVVAADVFIYIGDLEAVFAGVRRVLQPGGLFCFSVEQAADTVDYELRPSSRYAQSGRYLRELALRHGLAVDALQAGPLRLDQREPVAGLYVWLRG